MAISRRYWFLLATITCLGLLAISGFAVYRHYDGNIERFGDPFAGLGQRPAKVGDAMTFLVLGSDSRISAGNPATWKQGAQRTDAIMMVHIPADRSGVRVVSIPRDSWVSIPGHGWNKLNAAFAIGGPQLMITTVEKLTDVRVDHMVLADFTGFSAVTDSVGGVKLGGRQMNGAQALAYVRQRHGLPGGDLDRMGRQQVWMKAVVDKLLATTSLSNPLALGKRLNSLTGLMSVDSQLTTSRLRSTVLSLRQLTSNDVYTVTAPVSHSGMEGKQYVLYLASDEAEELWREMRTT